MWQTNFAHTKVYANPVDIVPTILVVANANVPLANLAHGGGKGKLPLGSCLAHGGAGKVIKLNQTHMPYILAMYRLKRYL